MTRTILQIIIPRVITWKGAFGNISMEWNLLTVGEKVHLYRMNAKTSMKEIAGRAHLSPSYLSKIENDKALPSMKIISRIADVLGTTAVKILSQSPFPSAAIVAPSTSELRRLAPTVVKKNERKKIHPPKTDLTYELLTPDLKRKLEFTMARHPAHHVTPVFKHYGEETILCLIGTVTVVVYEKRFMLVEGDSLSFDSSDPHQVINHSEAEAVLISANTPASF